MPLYHVDAHGGLREGMVLYPTYSDGAVGLAELFPDISRSARAALDGRLGSRADPGMVQGMAIELVFELVRRAEYGGLPSRFGAFCAVESVQAAAALRAAGCSSATSGRSRGRRGTAAPSARATRAAR